MKSPLWFDQRYKVNREIVREMRKLHKGGMSINAISKKFPISYHTAYYWIKGEYRARKQEKNRHRKKPEGEEKIRAIKQHIKRRRDNRKNKDYSQDRREDLFSNIQQRRQVLQSRYG